MITNTYKTGPTYTLCYIKGKRNNKTRSFWFNYEDEKLVRQHKWNINSKFYVYCTCHGYLLHRLITGAERGEVVDHINRLPQDNLRSNLRRVSHAENMWNRHANKNTNMPLPVKGVFWNGASWQTRIEKHGHVFNKAGFDTMHEAICWKIRREYELYGDKSPNYKRVLKKMPRHLLKIYFPEIYGEHNDRFIGSPIFNAHYKNESHKSWKKNCIGVRKAGATM